MKKKMLALLLSFCMVVTLSACTQNGEGSTTSDAASSGEPSGSGSGSVEPTPAEYVPTGAQMIAGKEFGKDYISLYDKFGGEVTIADVKEDPNTGFAYIEKDGQTYELGLDFLSMAMVYNTVCPEFGDEDKVYAEWFKYYITRWNALMPEIPLYANEYYDVFNAKIKGVEDNPTNPYWGPAQALIDWTSEKDDNSIILGNATDLTGMFRYSNFGVATPGSSDLDVENLTGGLDTVIATKEGGYEVNKTAVKDMQTVDNEDGSRTYTIEIYDDMKFSDGSPVTAKDYLYRTVAFSTFVSDEASESENTSGMVYAGFNSFKAYDGTNDGAKVDVGGEEVTVSKCFSGLRLLGDYKFSVTIDPSQLPYYYAITYAAFTPCYKDLWLGEYDIADDGNGVYITDGFYTKNGDSYAHAAHIKASANNTDTTYPYSGAYVVESYDDSAKQVTLKKNENFKGNYEGVKPAIEKVIITKVVGETQLDQLTSGGIDVLTGVTGGAKTNEAIKAVEDSNGAFVYTHYSRAGYGKLGFRADFGAVQFDEVRQAVAYCMDRAQFAKDFTGGYGGVVDGPYYEGSWMYKAAKAAGMNLSAYDTSADTAISVLEANGWIYNEKGEAYTEGVRYKKIPAQYVSENDKVVQSIDGAYKCVQVGDDWYMPLVINWFGTSENEFSELLVTGFLENENLKKAGFCIQNTIGDWDPMMDQRNQKGDTYGGTPMYNAFNFATGFTSTIYDYSYYLSINPMYAAYSMFFICDKGDVYMLDNAGSDAEATTAAEDAAETTVA